MKQHKKEHIKFSNTAYLKFQQRSKEKLQKLNKWRKWILDDKDCIQKTSKPYMKNIRNKIFYFRKYFFVYKLFKEQIIESKKF